MHGTTSGLAILHSMTLRPSNNGSRDIGRTRPPLLLFQAGRSGRYLGILSRCLAPAGSSLAEIKMLTSSHLCVGFIDSILTKESGFVKNTEPVSFTDGAFPPRSSGLFP